MKVILFGATGMVGQGVLRECLLDPEVDEVLSIGRSATGRAHPKLREILHPDLLDLSAIEADVSGAGTDSTERGGIPWARVKGRTENALLRLPLKAVMFRPAGIVPLHGITSKTRLCRVAYALTRALWSVLLKAFPQLVTTTEQVGRAMLHVAEHGSPKPILDTRAINASRGQP
jgi:uncharacterized protein YbjT (DUF2867 family)